MPNNKVPTALKLARGTHRKDRHGDPETEPKPDLLDVDTAAPDILDDEEAKIWNNLVPKLVKAGVGTHMDIDSIIEYCRDMVLEELIYEKIKACPVVEDDAPRRNQNYPSLNEVRARLKKFRADFGMTPSDRAGMTVSVKKGGSYVPTRPKDVGAG